MSNISRIIKTREIPEVNDNLNNMDKFMFSSERDTRTQVKMRFLDVEPKSDRFSDYLVLEAESKHLLVGYLLVFMLLFLIVLVI